MSTEVIVTDSELPSEVIDAIREGRKIEAIKLLREAKGLGLANAKVLVEQAWRTHGPEKEFVSFADEPQHMKTIVKSVAMALVVMAIYYVLKNS